MAGHLRAQIGRLIIGLALVAATDPALGNWQGRAPWISNEEQARLVEALRSKLSPAWTLTSRGLGTVPEDWQSLDARTFQIDGQNGDRSFHTWFLPADWIGIRRPHPNSKAGVYWEGVLSNSTYKAITVGEVAVQQAVQAMGMNTPSLVNSGWTRGLNTFGDRLTEIDQRTQELVRTFCTTGECVDEAAYSLILLGVPARSLTRDCAEHATGLAQGYCASALGYWGEPETVPLLSALVAASTTTVAVRRAAAGSLTLLADRSSGPALRQGLAATRSGDELSMALILDAIGRIRYAPAGPDVLARLLTESNRFTQARLAKTLADVQYAPAATAIQRLCRTTAITSEWIITNTVHRDQDDLPEMALLRLTAPWGAPTAQIRVLVMPPDTLTVPGRISIAVLIENVGHKDLEQLRNAAGVWVVDGKEYPGIDRPLFDGNMNVPVNGLDVRAVDLSPAISKPGTHSFQYKLLGATSNQLTLEFREARIAR